MIRNKIAVVFNFKDENLEFQKTIVNNGGLYHDNSMNLGRHANCRIISLELINNNWIITPESITFYEDGDKYVKKLNELKETHNLVSFKYIKDKNYTKDMSRYDQETLNKEHKEKIEQNLTWKLEVGGSLYDKLENSEITILDYIVKNDSANVIKYILNNPRVKENCGFNIENYNFEENKTPNCFKIINEYKREIEQEPYFSIDIEDL